MFLLMFLIQESPFYLNQITHIILVSVLILRMSLGTVLIYVSVTFSSDFSGGHLEIPVRKKRKGKWVDNAIKPFSLIL